MKKLKALVDGKKVYILAGIAVLAVWVDYFFGLGVSDVCKAMAEGKACTISLAEAANTTWQALIAAALRAGIAKV